MDELCRLHTSVCHSQDVVSKSQRVSWGEWAKEMGNVLRGRKGERGEGREGGGSEGGRVPCEGVGDLG